MVRPLTWALLFLFLVWVVALWWVFTWLSPVTTAVLESEVRTTMGLLPLLAWLAGVNRDVSYGLSTWVWLASPSITRMGSLGASFVVVSASDVNVLASPSMDLLVASAAWRWGWRRALLRRLWAALLGRLWLALARFLRRLWAWWLLWRWLNNFAHNFWWRQDWLLWSAALLLWSAAFLWRFRAALLWRFRAWAALLGWWFTSSSLSAEWASIKNSWWSLKFFKRSWNRKDGICSGRVSLELGLRKLSELLCTDGLDNNSQCKRLSEFHLIENVWIWPD